MKNLWTFPYTADKLLEAAAAKHNHYSERLEWWKNKREEIIAQIRAEGIEVDESVLAGQRIGSASNDVNPLSYNRQPTVQIRNDLVKDLTECVEKVKSHQQYVQEYDAWMQILASQGQSSLSVDHNDWLFFFAR